MPHKEHLLSIFAATIGNLLEWLDFTLFGLLSDEIGSNFFPSNTKQIQTLKTFALFAVAFFVRPLGAALFGYIGDKQGRSIALRWTLFMMAVPTFCIGCLPNYSSIGVAAPILLTLFRLMQGLSVGGEFSGALTYTFETSPVTKRVLYTILPTATADAGVLTGSIFVAILQNICTPTQLYTFGWRIPFLFGVFVAAFGVWMRQNLQKSEEFWKKKNEQGTFTNPLKEVLLNHKWNVFSVVIHYALHSASFYLLWVWFPSYVYATYSNIYLINGINITINITVMILSAYFIDRYMNSNPIRILILFGSLMSIYALIIFSYVEQIMDTGAMNIFFIQMIAGVLDGIYVSGINCWAILRFRDNTMLRYCGVGIAYNIAYPLFGGTAPLIASVLVLQYDLWTLGLLISCCGIMSVCINIICHFVVDVKHKNTQLMNAINGTVSETEPLERT